MEDLLQFLYLMPFGVVKFRADGKVDLMNAVASALLLSLRSDDSLRDFYASLAPLAPDLPQQVGRFAAAAGSIIDKQWLKARAGGRPIVLSLTVNRVDATVYMAGLADVTTLVEQQRKLYGDWSGPLGRTWADLTFDRQAGLSKDESSWSGIARTASNLSVRSRRSFWLAKRSTVWRSATISRAI
jgi:hypothetical protein